MTSAPPLPGHQDFSGQGYRPARGANLDGNWVWPGSEPQCFGQRLAKRRRPIRDDRDGNARPST
jgi:hypothetical protein